MSDQVVSALDALIDPLNVAAGYMKKIGDGEIPSKITEEYQGDFNDIKNSINACIDGLGAIQEGNSVMLKMSLNDYSEKEKESIGVSIKNFPPPSMKSRSRYPALLRWQIALYMMHRWPAKAFPNWSMPPRKSAMSSNSFNKQKRRCRIHS
jgi:hypothetical protein